MKTKFALSAVVFLSASVLSFAQGRDRGARPDTLGVSPLALGSQSIAWYGRLDAALAEAERSNRPIIFMSAASQCSGVPGVF